MPARRVIHRIARRLRRVVGGSGDAGFTLLEAVVSFVLFAVVTASATTAIVDAIRAGHVSQQRIDAADVAQSFIANAIQSAEQIAPQQGMTSTPYVGNRVSGNPEPEMFTVTETVTFDSGDTCSPGKLFTVNVEVEQAQTKQFLARSDARVACPPA